MFDRRFVLRALTAAMPALSLTGCDLIRRVLSSACPENPEESGGVDWIPSVVHPVFYGFQDLTTADGAPGPVRIWYPTYDGTTLDAPMLKLCAARWPVVLFLHGQQPQTCTVPNYYQLWSTLPAVLARSGFVVIAPRHAADLPVDALPADAWPWTLIDWVRSSWVHARWVDQRADANAIVGHSYGALLGARVERARPGQTQCYVSLGGTWSDLPAIVGSVGVPSLFMFTDSGVENLDSGGLWSRIPEPKHRAFYRGEHFDYIADIRDCEEMRGSCTRLGRAAADLVALFVSRHLAIPLANLVIPVTLNPQPVPQTQRQQFFSGGHLTGDGRLLGLDQFASTAGCRIDLSWEVGTATGSRTIGT